jgi:hypothetical protein
MIPTISQAFHADVYRAEINRANAQHSTGPKTEAGKQRSSLNALRHGLTGQIIVLPGDDLDAYQRHVQSYVKQCKPKGAIEAQLVQTLADTAWRLNRVAALENNLLTLGMVRLPDQLTDAPEQVQQHLAIAASLESQAKALANLSLHGQRLSRQFEKTLALLKQLQSERIPHEQYQLNQAANLVQMHEQEGEPYDPSEDGFVFSNREIQAVLTLRDRDQRAEGAAAYLANEDEDEYDE